jgi:predicted DNA binding protein
VTAGVGPSAGVAVSVGCASVGVGTDVGVPVGVSAGATVTSVDVESGSTPPRCVIEVDASTPEGVLAEHGARFERTVVEGGVATLSVSVPDDGTVAGVRESLAAAYADVTVSTIWTGRDDPGATGGDPLADLTDRQREVLRHAFDVGYFERPRGASATELAEHFGVARATVTQHLRTAERKLLGEVLARHGE